MSAVPIVVGIAAFGAVILILHILQIRKNRQTAAEMLTSLAGRVGGWLDTRPRYSKWLPLREPIATLTHRGTPVELSMNAYMAQHESGWFTRVTFHIRQHIDSEYVITRPRKTGSLLDSYLFRLPGEPSPPLSTGDPRFDDRFVVQRTKGADPPIFLTPEVRERLLRCSQVHTVAVSPRGVVIRWWTQPQPSTDELVAFYEETADVFDAIDAALPDAPWGSDGDFSTGRYGSMQQHGGQPPARGDAPVRP